MSVYFASIGSQAQPYDIWLTDYVTYSLVYSCKPIIPNLFKFETIWILGQKTQIDSNLIQKLLSFYASKGINIDIFEKSDQTGC